MKQFVRMPSGWTKWVRVGVPVGVVAALVVTACGGGETAAPTSPPAAPASPQTQPGMAEALRLGLSGVSRDIGRGLNALQVQLEAQAAQLRELAARTPAPAPPPAALIPPPAVSAPVAPPQAAPQRAPGPQARPQEVIPADDPRNQAYLGGGAVEPASGGRKIESRGPGGVFGNKGPLYP